MEVTEDSVAGMSGVPCSVIQYCPDFTPAKPPQQSNEANELSQNDEVSVLKEEAINGQTKNNTSLKLDDVKELPIECTKTNKNNSEILENIKVESIQESEKDEPILQLDSHIKEEKKNMINASSEGIWAEQGANVERYGVKREAEPDTAEEATPAKKIAIMNGDVKQEVEDPADEEEEEIPSESDEEIVKPRRRGRCKKNPELIPPHLAPDIALGYRMLLKFLETPQFSVFLRPGQLNVLPNPEGEIHINCLNQIKKKFEENSYNRLAEFVADVRAMLTHVYTAPRNPVAVKRALRLEQVLEQRIAQLPNYLRPQCALTLTPDEVSNSPKKIRINKGGGFVSLLLERADKERAEKDREKRKVLAEERKQMKEEQDKDVQEWEKNVLLKDHEEQIKSMWELPQIGHFIHLCANILNIGDVSQYEVERMLMMPQCSDTLDLLITALLSNSLVRAKLDRTPSMPYSIWLPLVRTRVNSWYRAYQREYGNAQKVFEEIGVEPEFWQVVGSEHSPLDYFNLHEIPLIQRVWILKTLCDVDFVRKKTVYDNMRQQLHEELQGTCLGVDRHGNRYIHFPQFGMTALRIYRQSIPLEEGILPADLVESQEGFEERRGEITLDKVFRDIWDVGVKQDNNIKKGRKKKKKQQTSVKMNVKIEPTAPKSLRQSARAKRKVYVDSTDSDCSDTDLATLKHKLKKPGKTFISLTVFRLPRDKVKPVSNKKSYYSRKLEREEAERLRLEEQEANKDKLSADEDASESLEPRLDDDDEDETKENFTVKNLDNLKMVLKKGLEDNDNAMDGSINELDRYRYRTPPEIMPDRNQFYCVVDSVEALRQLISQFASDDNDLEIINRSALRSGKKKHGDEVSCEVSLIERLQALLEDLEQWEADYLKTSRSIREKLYKEYTSFISRAEDFVHPNEAYWRKLYEEPPPVSAPPPESEPAPLSEPSNPPEVEDTPALSEPLAALRPRTRTRQQQQVAKLDEHELDEELDDECESSESDDNWELPSSQKKKKRVAIDRVPPIIPRTLPKRTPKKSNRNASPAGRDGALFWSSRSTDPSEELNWETNRQKILEKHNSPRKVVHADVDSDITEVENALRSTSTVVPAALKPRILPPPIPGNKKPYYSSAQLKVLAKKKENEVEIIGQKTTNQTSVAKRSPSISRPIKSVAKKSAGTQSSELVDLVEEPSQEEYFITDGFTYIKIEYNFVQELMKNQDAVRKFGDRLDLNKRIQIVKKKGESSPSQSLSNQKNLASGPTTSTAVPSSLRFIRPQHIATSQQQPVQFLRPPPPGYIYVQTSQPQGVVQVLTRPATAPNNNVGFIQMPAGTKQPVQLVQVSQGGSVVRPSMAVRLASTGQIVQLAAATPVPTGAQQLNLVQVQGLPGEPVSYIPMPAGMKPLGNVVHIQSPVKSSTQLGTFVQVVHTTQAGTINNTQGSDNSPQLVQVQLQPSSLAQDSNPQAVQLQLQTSTASISRAHLQESNSGAVQVQLQSTARLQASNTSPQLVQVQMQATSRADSGPQLVQLQLQPGSRAQLPSGSSPNSQVVQVQSSSVRPQAVQVQLQAQAGALPRTRAPVPETRPQLVQLQLQTTATNMPRPQGQRSPGTPTVTPSRLHGTDASPRPQTKLVQVYGSPRMQAATVQVRPGSASESGSQLMQMRTTASGAGAPQLVQVRPGIVSESGSHVMQVKATTSSTTAAQLVQVRPGHSPESEAQVMQVRLATPGGGTPQFVQVRSGQLSEGGPQVMQVRATAPGTAAPQLVQVRTGLVPGAQPQLLQVRPSTQSSQQPVGTVLAAALQRPAVSSSQPIHSKPAQSPASLRTTVAMQIVTSNGQRGPVVSAQRPTSPQLIQGAIGSSQAQSTSSSNSSPGIVQLSSAGRITSAQKVRAAVATIASSTSAMVQRSPASSVRPAVMRQVQVQGGKSAVYSIQLASEPKSGQPIFVRASGSKGSQPTVIKLEEEDDEIKIVRESVQQHQQQVDLSVDTVDILHGELSAKETPEGWRYSVKTSSGRDHVLTNSQVEARRAANNGRMF